MADLTATQQLTATLTITDRKGNPASVEGAPVWASSDETVATVESSADGMSGVVKAVAPGSGRVVVTADADLGEGVTPIIGTLDINVTPGTASVVAISAGPAEEQAESTPTV